MTVGVWEHPWLGALFGDAEVAGLFSAEAQLSRMLTVERALLDVAAEVGRIAPGDAEAARDALDAFRPDMAALAAGAARDGVVVPALVRQLRACGDRAGALHRDATSQDIVDTALALALRDLSAVLGPRLEAVIAALAALEAAQGARPLTARTRMQAALPVTAEHRIATWRRPLEALRDRLDGVTRDAARLQLGGPVGDRAGLGAEAGGIAEATARRLGLAEPGHAWHTERLGLVAYGDWLSHVAGALGKTGADIALMAQQGVDAARLAGGGASSSMPHKSNPVRAELLVALARFAAAQAGALHGALVHEQERSGSAWMLEWMVLPQLAAAAGRSLGAAQELVGSLEAVGDDAARSRDA